MTTPSTTAAERRLDKLTLARREVSRTKTRQALTAVQRLQAAGDPVTFARVARTAAVSTWFAYNNDEVAAAIREAQADQVENGLTPAPTQSIDRISAASLRVELEHTRHELRTIRGENAKLRQALALRLGAEMETTHPAETLTQLREAQEHSQRLAQQLALANNIHTQLANQLATTEEDLASARVALRRTMRPLPTPVGETCSTTRSEDQAD